MTREEAIDVLRRLAREGRRLIGRSEEFLTEREVEAIEHLLDAVLEKTDD